MKKFLVFIFLLLLNNLPVMAYQIGGAYAQLVTCVWSQYGYEYGYIGTYKVNNQIITQFFGSNYCPA